ncbi:SpoIIE family protein phosphatase, partial [Actinosynnema sp. NPDC023658]|uniref:SpoIIE family protein phosphatase n=1 Tax=Actinosynnema sp. NPDC023658 TaxID=3155465 RepID=UPI0033F1EDD0
RRAHDLELPPGALLALYTDGLVERRGQDLDARLEALRQVVRPVAPETACARIMADLVGDRPANDDIALVTIRRGPDPAAPGQ